MNTVLVGLGVGALLGLVIPQLFADDWFDRIFGAFVGIIIGCLILGGASAFVAAGIGSGKPQHRVVTEKHQLISLQDATNYHGGFAGVFFLWSAHVDSDVRIYYYEATPDGYQLHWKSETDPDVYIVQENRTDGELDVMSWQFQNASDGTWGIPRGGQIYVFHVPNGSITTCFQLSAGQSTSSCPSGS